MCRSAICTRAHEEKKSVVHTRNINIRRDGPRHQCVLLIRVYDLSESVALVLLSRRDRRGAMSGPYNIII